MAAWCRIWWGDDGWLQLDSRMITAAVLAALAVLVCGCEARGDVGDVDDVIGVGGIGGVGGVIVVGGVDCV